MKKIRKKMAKMKNNIKNKKEESVKNKKVILHGKILLMFLICFGVFTILVSATTLTDPITSCGDITSPGYYHLTSSISSTGTCINITTDNVTLDGSLYGLTFNSLGLSNQYGILIAGGHTNISVINFNIINDSSSVDPGSNVIGIFANDSLSNSIIYNNFIKIYSVSGNSSSVMINGSSYSNNFTGNNMNSYYDLFLYNSTNDTIVANNLNATYYGVYFFNSSINSISVLNISNNNITLYSGGYCIYSNTNLSNSVIYNNTLSGTIGGSGIWILSPIFLNNTISNNKFIFTSGSGIYLSNSTNSTISNNQILASSDAINISISNSNLVSNNNLTSSTGGRGLELYTSNRSIFSNNTIEAKKPTNTKTKIGLEYTDTMMFLLCV